MTVADADEITTFTFSRDNPCNTTISRSPGEVVYSIVTENAPKATFTIVRDAGDEIIGSLEWRDVLSDRVIIGSNRPKSRIPLKSRKYRWKGLAPGSTPFVCLVHSYCIPSDISPLLV
ncbi:hypothetical protein BC629DRAFT_1487050 [Irpex lacteus]|nr:hypothetical protein BC629DRAFT_1487050 [Irpex lacteus]